MNFITFEKTTKQFDNDDEFQNYLDNLITSLAPEYEVTSSFVNDDCSEEDFVGVIILQNANLEMKIIVYHNLKKLNENFINAKGGLKYGV